MTATPPEYTTCFHPGDRVSVGMHLADKTFAEDSATVIALHGAQLRLELCGNGFPPHLVVPTGSRGVTVRLEERNLFICSGILKAPVTGRMMTLDLVENMRVINRREYARADVDVQLVYSLPASQDMGRIMNEWEELKTCPDNCHTVDLPSCRRDCRGKELRSCLVRANLGGNGLRFKILDCLSYGTLLHLKIVIPHEQRHHIHAVGSIVRTVELLPTMEQNDYYSTAMTFKVIDSPDRTILLEYILNEQRRAIL